MSAATKKQSKPKAAPEKAGRLAKITTPGVGEIRMERVLDAPIERVWRAYTQPELVAQWWGRGNKLVIEQMDFRPGGKWRYVEHSDHGVHGFYGTYGEIVPMERIVLTFGFDGMPGPEGDCVVEFVDLGNGKTMLVDRSLCRTSEERDAVLKSGMVDGANQSYAALERLLATLA